MFKNFDKIGKKGISLYLTLVVLSVLMTCLLTLVGIFISQIKIIWTLGDSVTAFYAADTGIEQALYRIRKQGDMGSIPDTPLGEASFNVSISTSTGEIIIKSRGSYRGTKRAIEVVY